MIITFLVSDDPNRIIHYNGGQLIALASDKKLHLVNVEDGKAINKKPITGHAGSIQCAYVEEKEVGCFKLQKFIHLKCYNTFVNIIQCLSTIL